MALKVPQSIGGGPRLSLTPQLVGAADDHSSRNSVPRTLPYFANFKSMTISYKPYSDIEGGYRKQLKQRQFQFPNGKCNRLHVRGHLVEKKLEKKGKEENEKEGIENGNGRVKSANDSLDEHLSKLTLGGVKSAASSRNHMNAKSTRRPNKAENLLDSSSDDSMLIRQAQKIEKGVMRRKRSSKNSVQLEIRGTKRAPLAPSIVTLVHTGLTHTSKEKEPDSPNISSTESEWSTLHVTNELCATSSVNSDQDDLYSYCWDKLADREALIPDCTTLDSPFVRQQPRSADSPVRLYQMEKLYQQQYQPRLQLCEKVRYSDSARRRANSTTPQPSQRVGENPSVRSKTPGLPPRSILKHKKKRPNTVSVVSDPMKGFGPWVAEQDRGSNQTFINTVSMVPRNKKKVDHLR